MSCLGGGYIDKEKEVIVGLESEEVLGGGMKGFGGMKVVEKGWGEKGVEVEGKVKDILSDYGKSDKDGVLDG